MRLVYIPIGNIPTSSVQMLKLFGFLAYAFVDYTKKPPACLIKNCCVLCNQVAFTVCLTPFKPPIVRMVMHFANSLIIHVFMKLPIRVRRTIPKVCGEIIVSCASFKPIKLTSQHITYFKVWNSNSSYMRICLILCDSSLIVKLCLLTNQNSNQHTLSLSFAAIWTFSLEKFRTK